MSELAWLVALEEIRQLKARRDRYVDAHDWDAYAALHAPDHVSDSPPVPTQGREAMMAGLPASLAGTFYTHHCHDAEIRFETPTRAHAVWAMTGGGVFPRGGEAPGWLLQMAYYHESYEKRGDAWLFTYSKWERYLALDDREAAGTVAVTRPVERVGGTTAFDRFAPGAG